MKKLFIAVLLVSAGAGAAVLGYRYIQPQHPISSASNNITSTTTASKNPQQKEIQAAVANAPEELKKLADKILITDNTSNGDVKVSYKTLSMNADKALTINNVEFNIKNIPNPVPVDKIVVTKYDQKNTPPHFYAVQFKGFHLNNKVIPDPKFMLGLAALGLSEILIDIDVTANFDSLSKTQTGTFSIVFQQLAKLTFDATLTDFDIATLAQMSKNAQPNPMALLNAFKVSKLKIRFQNLGLKEKLKDKLTPEILQQAQANLKREISRARHPIHRLIVENASKFIGTQNGFEISIEPTTPMSIMSFIAIPENKIISQLKFKVSTQ